MGIKNLSKQTLWYGLPSIVSRIVFFLLTPYLTLQFSEGDYGDYSLLYSLIPFMLVLSTYGMETALFRFFTAEVDGIKVYSTASLSIALTTILFCGLLLALTKPIAELLRLSNHPTYIVYAIVIIGLDTLASLPFALLRLQGKTAKFGTIRVVGIGVNMLLTYFFVSVCPKLLLTDHYHWLHLIYNEQHKLGYVILANLIQSALTMLLLLNEWKQIRWQIDLRLFTKMISYSFPLLIAGIGGVINESFDRFMLSKWLTNGSDDYVRAQIGIYSACYKLSIPITLCVQAFKMGAEPFFFKMAGQQDAPKTYARLMKYFIIVLCIVFLFVSLFLNYWKYFIRNPAMYSGLRVVPILLVANIFLGIYYNLSVWYKLKNKTYAAALITALGVLVTLAVNYLFIPRYGYMASAWATLLCYGSMMVYSHQWGQRIYPIPYAQKKLITYFIITLLLYFVNQYLQKWLSHPMLQIMGSLSLLASFIYLVVQVEKQDFKKLRTEPT